MIRRFYYTHLAMPLYRLYAFLFPIYVPRGFDHLKDNVLTLGRAPFFIVWPQRARRNARIYLLRRELRRSRVA